MDRFNDLEKAWESKQRKRKVVLGVLALTVVLSYAAYTQFFDTSQKIPKPKNIQQIQQETKIPTTAVKEEPKQPETIMQETLKCDKPQIQKEEVFPLSLNKSFEEVIEKSSYEIEKPEKKTIGMEEKSQGIDENFTKQQEKEPEPSPAKIEKEEIKQSDMATVYIEEYLLDQTYEKALKIAKYYFDNGQYQKAIKWSLTANKINSADDESWLVFANSSISLGLEDQAKKALSTYLLKRDSIRVRQLYNKIK